jgi:hypothetical protein
MVSNSGLWPTLLATWLSITPVAAAAPEPGAGAAPVMREASLPARRD